MDLNKFVQKNSLPIRYSSAQARALDEGFEAELGIAPLKEGSKSSCRRDTVNTSGSCSHVSPTSTVGNVSNERKMVKVN